MRLLPIEPVARAPRLVRGLCIIRGSAVPVVDVGRLFESAGPDPQAPPSGDAASGRLVTIRVEGRVIALAVDAVLGVRPIAATDVEALPPLLSDASGDGIAALGTLDAGLLMFLNTARLVPEAWLDSLDAAAQLGEPDTAARLGGTDADTAAS